MKRNTILTLIVFFFCMNAFTLASAQIKGLVQDKTSGRPIDMADVILMDKSATTVVNHVYSDSNGHFQITTVKEGEYSLMIRGC